MSLQGEISQRAAASFTVIVGKNLYGVKPKRASKKVIFKSAKGSMMKR